MNRFLKKNVLCIPVVTDEKNLVGVVIEKCIQNIQMVGAVFTTMPFRFVSLIHFKSFRYQICSSRIISHLQNTGC